MWIEYILVGLIIALAAAAVIRRIYRRATGKTSDCNCSACENGAHCAAKLNLPDKETRS